VENDFSRSFSTFRFQFPFIKMRLDLYLKVSRLIPRRSLAQEFCDAGLIKINGAVAKSSKEVKTGDEIEIHRRNRIQTIGGRPFRNSRRRDPRRRHSLARLLKLPLTTRI
jgi:ribosomal 50S subunit-recycling heat shock protein